MIEDAVGDSATIERPDALTVTVPEDRVVLKRLRFEVIAHLPILDSGEKQINIDMVVDELEARHEGLSHHNQILDPFSLSQDLGKHFKEVRVSLDVDGSHAQGINISGGSVDFESEGAKRKDLASPVLVDVLIHSHSAATLLDPLLNNVLQVLDHTDPMVELLRVLVLAEIR